jgi:8-oxo-dGTP diphosphatase
MPEATVAAIIYDKASKGNLILLTLRDHDPFRNFWCIPGGHIEKWEKAEQAICREVKEETNLDFKPVFFQYFEEIFPDRNIHNVVLVFIGTSSGTLLKRTPEVYDAKWLSVDEAIKMNLAFAHKDILIAYANLLKKEKK